MKRIRLHSGKYAVVDDDLFDLLSQYTWYEKKEKNQSYAMRRVSGEKNTKMRMHREIMGLQVRGSGMVDHINGDGLDNRRCNLRLATKSQNGANKPVKKGKSMKYVYFIPRTGHWYVLVNTRSCHHYGGYFRRLEDAEKVAERLAVQVFGEFSRVR